MNLHSKEVPFSAMQKAFSVGAIGTKKKRKLVLPSDCVEVTNYTYTEKENKTFEDVLDFHVKFERIHPFQDGNGRVGRLIMFKECLKHNIVPFIIENNLKIFYYRESINNKETTKKIFT